MSVETFCVSLTHIMRWKILQNKFNHMYSLNVVLYDIHVLCIMYYTLCIDDISYLE